MGSEMSKSEKSFKDFLQAAQVDGSLQEQLVSAADANAVSEIAKAAGFNVSPSELRLFMAACDPEYVPSFLSKVYRNTYGS